jgi:hypothetical protein
MAWTTPGTAVAGSVLTAAFLNTNLRDNMIELAPFAEAWVSYTPTFTNLTIGNGSTTSAYLKVGKLVTVRFQATFGSTTNATSTIIASLPEPAISYQANFPLGVGWLFDNSAPTYFALTPIFQTTTTLRFLAHIDAAFTQLTGLTHSNVANITTGNATGDIIAATFTYEAA